MLIKYYYNSKFYEIFKPLSIKSTENYYIILIKNNIMHLVRIKYNKNIIIKNFIVLKNKETSYNLKETKNYLYLKLDLYDNYLIYNINNLKQINFNFEKIIYFDDFNNFYSITIEEKLNNNKCIYSFKIYDIITLNELKVKGFNYKIYRLICIIKIDNFLKIIFKKTILLDIKTLKQPNIKFNKVNDSSSYLLKYKNYICVFNKVINIKNNKVLKIINKNKKIKKLKGFIEHNNFLILNFTNIFNFNIYDKNSLKKLKIKNNKIHYNLKRFIFYNNIIVIHYFDLKIKIYKYFLLGIKNLKKYIIKNLRENDVIDIDAEYKNYLTIRINEDNYKILCLKSLKLLDFNFYFKRPYNIKYCVIKKCYILLNINFKFYIYNINKNNIYRVKINHNSNKNYFILVNKNKEIIIRYNNYYYIFQKNMSIKLFTN